VPVRQRVHVTGAIGETEHRYRLQLPPRRPPRAVGIVRRHLAAETFHHRPRPPSCPDPCGDTALTSYSAHLSGTVDPASETRQLSSSMLEGAPDGPRSRCLGQCRFRHRPVTEEVGLEGLEPNPAYDVRRTRSTVTGLLGAHPRSHHYPSSTAPRRTGRRRQSRSTPDEVPGCGGLASTPTRKVLPTHRMLSVRDRHDTDDSRFPAGGDGTMSVLGISGGPQIWTPT